MKPLAGGARAVLLLNRGVAPAEIAATWEQLGLPERLSATVRDLWAHRDLGRRKGSVRATVASHAAVVLRVQP